MNVLYINSCVREESRTDRLAKKLLTKFGPYREFKLDETEIAPLSREQLAKRTTLIEKQDYSDPMFDYAREFSQADVIVISAPFWDLSFPASLKIFIENIYVTGLVSKYSPEGVPIGLCRASKLYYITTAGGKYEPAYSYNYIRDMAMNCFGIQNVQLLKAEMLDVVGFDAGQIMKNAFDEIEELSL